MSKVIQIRDVPSDIHEALSAAARARKLSLTKFILTELEQVAVRAQAVEANALVVRDTQAKVRGRASREEILGALREGRGE